MMSETDARVMSLKQVHNGLAEALTLFAIRSVDQPRTMVSLDREVSITVHLTEAFRIRRRSEGHTMCLDGKVGQFFFDTPEQETSITVDGLFQIVQMRMSVAQFRSIALEDHEIDVKSVPPMVSCGPVNYSILRVLCAAQAASWISEEDTRYLVSLVLAQNASRPTSAFKGGLSPSKLKRVYDLVDADINNVNLSSMAAAASLSPFHFSREFKRVTGQAPWSYVITRRTTKALTLLMQDLSLTEVTARSGFTHIGHLNQRLRMLTGMTAGQLRRTVLL